MNTKNKFIAMLAFAVAASYAQAPGGTAEQSSQNEEKTYQDYLKDLQDKKVQALSENYHHGVTLQVSRLNDSEYGNMKDDFVWGMGGGVYYFYRYYFLQCMAIQPRFGLLYRYGRFDSKDKESKKLKNGDKVDLTSNVEITYDNIALDIPATLKIGTNIEPTTFVYLGATFGITKSLLEQASYTKTLDATSSDKKTKENIEYLKDEGLVKLPKTERHEINEPFMMDDWEFSGWLGAGIDGKYASLEFQMLIVSKSLDNNHAYEQKYDGSWPTFRIMVDFSMR